MRLAVISDTHGNSHALDAVLADIGREMPDAVVCLGDTVSGPMDPAGTADRLMALNCPVVAGNHDRWLAENGEADHDPVDRFAATRLGPAHWDWLKSLPATRVVEDDIFLCHGTPTSDIEPWLDNLYDGRAATLPDEETVTRRAGGLDYPLMLCGHTHIPRSVRLRDGRLVVNPGSVGLQFVHGSPDAHYALVDRREGEWSVSLRSIAYDREEAARQAVANGFPQWREPLLYGWAGPEGLF